MFKMTESSISLTDLQTALDHFRILSRMTDIAPSLDLIMSVGLLAGQKFNLK